jgi:predicted AlkP superfamily pyrophosphatase or phosphodiesterase
MKMFLPLMAFVAVLLFAAAAHAAPATDRIVVLISVDGLAHYYFDDPKAEMPTIRQLAAAGARAEKMKCVLPTVTWPNHTTLVTGVNPGRHGVLGNDYLDRAKGESVALIADPIFDKEEIVKVPTIYDVAKSAGLKTAAIIWPASRGAKTLDWTVPDVFTNALWEAHGTPALLAECKAAGIPVEKQEEWCKGKKDVERDQLYTQMFNHLVRTHRPNLALLHLINVDHVEHATGPQTPEAYAAVKLADDRVREVWDELKKHFSDKATLIVVSDHGFFSYRQQIQPNVLLRDQGLLETAGTKISGGKVRAMAQGGACFVYVLDETNREALIPRVAELFQKVEGVDAVLTPADYPQYGLADPRQDGRMADLVLCARDGYAFSNQAAGEVVTEKWKTPKGTHGYDPNQPGMHATFVAWGVGVRSGVTLGTIGNIDVAPTLGALLGVPMKDVDGRVLEEIVVK